MNTKLLRLREARSDLARGHYSSCCLPRVIRSFVSPQSKIKEALGYDLLKSTEKCVSAAENTNSKSYTNVTGILQKKTCILQQQKL